MTTQDRLTAALAATYAVKKEIGAGGMATVFLAHDLKHDRDVAVKVLHPDLGAALGSERFLSEIKTTAKLQHPHILPLIDSGSADSLLYYVMPFVVGESLRQRMDREGQLPVSEAIRIAREVAGALDYAHRNGVVHRDIKPENILLNDGQALVADFGIALAVSAAGGARMTQTGLSLGTPQYMSPEQAMGERTIDARSDIYALGAVTYEMLTGEPPFTGANVQAIVSKIMSQKPTPVSAVRDTVPPATEEAVMTALCKLPADRFATAALFASALTTGSGNFTSSSTVRRTSGRRRTDIIANRIGIPAIPVALIAIGLALWNGKGSTAAAPVLRYSIVLDSGEDLSDNGGARMAVSPDGSMLVFAGGPRNELFLRKRNEFTARRIANTEGAVAPSFSPDGKQIVFSTFTFELKRVSVSRGDVTQITDSIVGRGAVSWGDDGYIYGSGRAGGPLVRIRTEGGVVEGVTVLNQSEGEVQHLLPNVLPGSKGVVFTVGSVKGGRGFTQIAVSGIGSRKHRVLFEGGAPIYSSSGYLLYRGANRSLMAIRFDPESMKTTGEPVAISDSQDSIVFAPTDFMVSQTGTFFFVEGRTRQKRQLMWVSRDGRHQPVDSMWNGAISFPAISPDGKRVVVASADQVGPADIWVKVLDRGPATKLTLTRSDANYPAWTPDGQSVTYYSGNATGNGLRLWRKRADASEQAVEIVSAQLPVESEWSPDGKWLIYRTSVALAGKGDILAIRPGIDSTPLKIAATTATEQQPAISRNGRWLAYVSNETGKFEVYVVPFPNTGAAKWAISRDGGSEPAWSRDGRELFYRDAKGTMVAVPVQTGTVFSAGTPKDLFPALEYLSGSGHRFYDVAPDGRFMMVGGRGAATDRIYVVENWFQELNKKFK